MHKSVKGPSRKSRFEESGDAIYAEARSVKSSGARVIVILSRASNTWQGQADNAAFSGSVPSVSDRTATRQGNRTETLSAQIVKIEEGAEISGPPRTVGPAWLQTAQLGYSAECC
jgi:hypothetical protein